jgi:hypothetical protein
MPGAQSAMTLVLLEPAMLDIWVIFAVILFNLFGLFRGQAG